VTLYRRKVTLLARGPSSLLFIVGKVGFVEHVTGSVEGELAFLPPFYYLFMTRLRTFTIMHTNDRIIGN
jgi:hypothetical protein